MSGKLYGMSVCTYLFNARDLLKRNGSSALMVWYVKIVLKAA